MKLTPWYPSNIKPVREGWYECIGCFYKHWWDGYMWRPSPTEKGFSDQDIKWRGVAK